MLCCVVWSQVLSANIYELEGEALTDTIWAYMHSGRDIAFIYEAVNAAAAAAAADGERDSNGDEDGDGGDSTTK